MSTKFKTFDGDWQSLRLPGTREVDFHNGRRPRDLPYMQAMAEVHEEALAAIRLAHEDGCPYLLIGHGYSTSRAFHVTARSQIRRLMRSPEVTPYVDRGRCVQHNACFLVALKNRDRQGKLAGVLQFKAKAAERAADA